MNFRLFIYITVLSLLVVGGYFYSHFAEKTNPKYVIAKLNGKEISLELAQTFMESKHYKDSDYYKLSKNEKEHLLKELEAQNILIEEAKNSGMLESPKVKMMIDSYIASLVSLNKLNEITKQKVSEEEVKKLYETVYSNLENRFEYKARMITVSSQAEIEQVVTSLHEGKIFEDLAKERSKFNPQIAGDMGFIITGLLPQRYDAIFTDLKPGDVSKPFRNDLGWSIIKLESKNPAQITPLENIKEQLELRVQHNRMLDYQDSLTHPENLKIELLD